MKSLYWGVNMRIKSDSRTGIMFIERIGLQTEGFQKCSCEDIYNLFVESGSRFLLVDYTRAKGSSIENIDKSWFERMSSAGLRQTAFVVSAQVAARLTEDARGSINGYGRIFTDFQEAHVWLKQC